MNTPPRFPCLLAGALACALALSHAGCSESSARPPGVASASAGASAAPAASNALALASSGAWAAAGGLGPIPAAPASVGTHLDAFNEELQVVWDELRPLALRELGQAIGPQLVGQRYQSRAVEVELSDAQLGAVDLSPAPGLLRFDAQQVRLRLPGRGEWSLELELRLRVRLRLGRLSPRVTIPVRVRLRQLSVEVALEFDDSDPTRPVLRRVTPPQIDFRLEFSSSSALLRRVTPLLNRPANWAARRAVQAALAQLTPTLANVSGLPGAIPAEGAPRLLDSGLATPFEAVAVAVEDKLRQVNSPHGLLLRAQLDQPSDASWLEAYRPGGRGLEGNVVGHDRGHDSAIWTGHYLGAAALRYAVTQDPAAEDHARHALGGIGALLDVNGGTGLLARVAAPAGSALGIELDQRGEVFARATIQGQPWVGYQSKIGVTRDQYSGVFFGLALAYEHVPALRAESARRLRQMLDYLLARDWLVTEDRPQWNGQNGSRGPLFWLGSAYQKLTYLLIGHRVDPRYAQPLAEAGPLAETAWLTAWTGALNTDQYYKFNLAHTNLYNYFRLETDPARWQAMRRAYAITERYVGHHANAHFDLIRATVDPAPKPDLQGSAREALRQFLATPHRYVALPVIDLSAVTWQDLVQSGYQNTSGGGVQLVQTKHRFPSAPLAATLRRPAKDFFWQRDPFSPAAPGWGDPQLEKTGLDLLLPYWLGRHHGAF